MRECLILTKYIYIQVNNAITNSEFYSATQKLFCVTADGCVEDCLSISALEGHGSYSEGLQLQGRQMLRLLYLQQEMCL